LPGTSYYRLKQTDFSGQSVTFDPVTVSCSDANSENTGITLIYPNPAVNEVFVKINCLENSNGQLIVYNTIGQKIIEQQLTLLNGENVYTIDISGFAEGIYPITFNNEQGVSCTRKIIKSKQ
jgi:Secretion system C-terminal sorting domain